MFGKKGKISIDIPTTNYVFGDTVKGKALLDVKKPVKSKGFVLTLIATEKKTRGYGKNRSTHYVRVFDFKLDLDSEKDYSIGQQTFDFSIQLPKSISSPNTQFGQTMETIAKVANTLNATRASIKWHLTAKVKVPGLLNNIRKRVQLSVTEKN